jgi:tetratricopeptide (TPR) repeat protein
MMLMRRLFLLPTFFFFCATSHGQLPHLSSTDQSSPIFLQALKVDVSLIGNKAITTFTLSFHNPSQKTLEGQFLFPLPQGAIVTRYALDIDGKMREGVPVEKARAAQVFEAVEKRRIDPGLLEKTEGNNFRTRIYPVPAQGERSIIVAFEQELSVNEKNELVYHLPLSSASTIEQISVCINTLHNENLPLLDSVPVQGLSFTKEEEGYRAFVSGENIILHSAVSFRIPQESQKTDVFVQSKNGQHFFYLHTSLPSATKAKKLPQTLAVIWDNSLSGLYRDTAKELRLLKAYLSQCRDVLVKLYSLHNTFRPEGVFAVKKGNYENLLQRIRALAYDGGTDYTKIKISHVDETLLFSDGQSTASDTPFPSFPHPVYTITSSPKSDYNALRDIAESNGGVSINLKAQSDEQALESLTREALFFLGIKGSKKVFSHYPSSPAPVGHGFAMAGTFDGKETTLRLQFGYGRKVTFKRIVFLSAERDTVSANWDISRLVAQKRLTELEKAEETNREDILRLGREYSLVTSFTSLLVLERVEDYVQHEIQPPVELLEEYNKLMQEKRSEITERKKEIIQNAIDYSDKLWAWWKTAFPLITKPVERFTSPQTVTDRGSAMIADSAITMRAPVIKMDEEYYNANVPRQEETVRRSLAGSVAGVQLSEVVVTGYSANISIRGLASASNSDRQLLVVDGEVADVLPEKDQIQKVEVLSEKAGVSLYGSKAMNGVLLITTKAAKEISATIAKQKSNPEIQVGEKQSNADYMRVMRRTPLRRQYQLYLSLRENNLLNPAFYYDMANFFLKRDKVVGLQILTNLGELDFQNHELYKLYGFKLKELRETELAENVFRKVLQWRPQEPQSYRDYALTLLENKKYQQALDTLYLALSKEYSEDVMSDYDGIEETIVTEINHLTYLFPNKVKATGIPKKFRHNMPVDVRVVLNWNMNDIDIDLWITDPRGEKCYYQNRETAIGGRLSEDFTEGYGPEQFLLKKAPRGKYIVHVNYYGNNRTKIAGKTTLVAEIYTNYGQKNEERKLITLQLEEEEKEGVYVGAFTF